MRVLFIEDDAMFGKALVQILDQGIGIPDAMLPRIFDRFVRANPDASEGSGLGLAIAKAAAERTGMGLVIANRADRRGICATIAIGSSEGDPTPNVHAERASA